MHELTHTRLHRTVVSPPPYQVLPNALRNYHEVQHLHGLVTAVLGLQLQLESRHFHDGTVRVRCVASVSPLLWQGGKESILHRRPSAQYEDREAMRLGECVGFGARLAGWFFFGSF